MPFPIVLGFDTARSIVEVGENVTNWQVTDHVFARKQTSPQGSYAEFVAVDDHLLAKIPEILTFEEAGATPLAGLTSWQALFDKGHLQPDETVVIHGGSGGVGTFSIQLAKYHGAKIITTTSSKNVQLLKKLGADQIIDYQQRDFSIDLNNVDLVIDTLGGQVLNDSFHVLSPRNGRIVTIIGTNEADS